MPAPWSEIEHPIDKYGQGTFDSYGTWIGVPSPAFPPTAAGTLDDGFYPAFAAAPWTTDTPESLSITLRRLESCSTPGMVDKSASCDAGGTVVGVDPDSVFETTIPLDGSVKVVLLGSDCSVGPDGATTSIVKAGDGTSLRSLFADYTAAYEAVITPRLADTADIFQVMADVAAAPAGGFVGAGERCLSSLVFESGDAPPVLLQGIVSGSSLDGSFEPLTASEAIRLDSVEVVDGSIIMYYSAGFRS